MIRSSRLVHVSRLAAVSGESFKMTETMSTTIKRVAPPYFHRRCVAVGRRFKTRNHENCPDDHPGNCRIREKSAEMEHGIGICSPDFSFFFFFLLSGEMHFRTEKCNNGNKKIIFSKRLSSLFFAFAFKAPCLFLTETIQRRIINV